MPSSRNKGSSCPTSSTSSPPSLSSSDSPSESQSYQQSNEEQHSEMSAYITLSLLGSGSRRLLGLVRLGLGLDKLRRLSEVGCPLLLPHFAAAASDVLLVEGVQALRADLLQADG